MNNPDPEQLGGISVVIPAYNVGEYISRTIDSVLGQTYKPDEIIIVDDGSTDNTANEIKKYGSKVIYIYQGNAGASVARNTGIEAAGGEWIAFLDSDDEWLADKLQLQVEHLHRNPQLVWTSANFYRCLCDEDRRAPDIDPQQGEKLLKPKEYFDEFFEAFAAHTGGCTITMMIKKEVLQEAGMFRPGQLLANDIDLWFRIAYQWPRIGFISRPLAIYHMTVPQSITKKYQKQQRLRELVGRHLKLSADYGRREAFEHCAGHMVTGWIRGLIFENRPEDIGVLTEEFGELLGRRFRMLIRFLMISPKTTAIICHLISKVVRALGLRRQAVHRPKQIRKTGG